MREFSSFTDDLEALAEWLTECGVDVVAMESTGVYWIPCLSCSNRAVQGASGQFPAVNITGRKSDVLDCQWLEQQMSSGLSSAAFRPVEDICALRAVARQRDMLAQARQAQWLVA